MAKTAAWQRKEGKNPKGGLSAKGVASYRAANPGSKLKMAVTTKPSKLKAGSVAAKAEQKRMTKMQNDYLNQGSGRVSTGKVKAKYAKGVINPGRAQPPRTAPNSSGQGGRYSRLTGGLLKHGR